MAKFTGKRAYRRPKSQPTDYRIYAWIAVRNSDITPQLKQEFGTILANYGSGESAENEAKGWDSVLRLSVSGEEPAQVRMIGIPLKKEMRSELQPWLLTNFPGVRWYVVRNVVLQPGQFLGQLMATTDEEAPLVVPGEPPWDTEPFELADVLADLYADRGLQVIVPEDI